MKAYLGKYKKDDSRRVDVKIDKFDTYSLDRTLAHIILPSLIQIKQCKMGVPTEFACVGGAEWESQDSFDFYKETHEEAFNIGCARWEEILDKMIWSFQQILLENYEQQYHHGKPKFDWEPAGQLLNPSTGKMEDVFQMVDKNPDEHWIDMEGLRLHEERIQEGLELFGKYYKHLWD